MQVMCCDVGYTFIIYFDIMLYKSIKIKIFCRKGHNLYFIIHCSLIQKFEKKRNLYLRKYCVVIVNEGQYTFPILYLKGCRRVMD